MSHPPVPPLSWSKRLLYLGCAAFFFLLAVIGIVLPIVPATPFLLVTSYFLVRSFPKLNDLLLEAPYFGPILYDWEVRKGIKTSVKIQAIATVVLGWGISIMVFPIPAWAIYVMAGLVMTGIYVIYRVPEPRPLPPKEKPVAGDKSEVDSPEGSTNHAAHRLEMKRREWDRNQRQAQPKDY